MTAPPMLVAGADASWAVRGGVRHYPGRRLPVFEGLDFRLGRGERVAILGPNGCGKSTLLRIVLGLDTLDAGEVETRLSPYDRVGAVLQDYRRQLLPGASVRTNLELPIGGRHVGLPDAAALGRHAHTLLERAGYGLAPDARVGLLSGGQQQALVLARALVLSPSVYVWDEPTSAIDLARRRTILHEVRAHWEAADATAIVVTHDTEEALMLADRVCVYDAGMRLVAEVATPRDGLGDPAAQRDVIRRALLGDPPARTA